jgi:hypothetical protein
MHFITKTVVEADSLEEAKDFAGDDDDEFEVTANYLHKPGGPSVEFSHLGAPELFEGELE